MLFHGARTVFGVNLETAMLPLLSTLVLIVSTSAIMTIRGLELELDCGLDFDRNLRSVGGANIAAGLVGGVAASPSLLSIALTHRMGGTGRTVGLVNRGPGGGAMTGQSVAVRH